MKSAVFAISKPIGETLGKTTLEYFRTTRTDIRLIRGWIAVLPEPVKLVNACWGCTDHFNGVCKCPSRHRCRR